MHPIVALHHQLYMSAQVLLNLSNKFGGKYKMQGLSRILLPFRNNVRFYLS